MNRKAFYHLLKRYAEGACTEDEKKLVEQWYELLGDDEDQETALTARDIKASLQRMWPKIQEQTMLANKLQPTAAAAPRRVIPVLAKWAGAAAAVVLLTLLGVGYFVAHRSATPFSQRVSTAGMQHVVNATAANDTVLLNDGSQVVLEPDAALSYPARFTGTKREVYLDGNAFFKVSRNPKCPFYVYSSNIVTQVLGTSFFVKNNAMTNDVEVSVRTGKVAVYEYGQEIVNNRTNDEAGGVILKPNQKVIYNTTNHHFRTTLVEAPLPVVQDPAGEKITALNFVFDETPVAKVLSCLEQAYHIEMVMENETLGNCLFSGDIKGQDLYDQLEIICAAVQATYEIRGTRILIKGAGCD